MPKLIVKNIFNFKRALLINRAFLILFTVGLVGCFESKKEFKMTKAQQEQQALIDRGKAVYMSECIACHNLNPKFAGSIGPDVYGSSLELLEARLLRLEYPKGYKPKRESDLMPDFPELEADIPAIHAFLNQK